jgi:hypothetical protein
MLDEALLDLPDDAGLTARRQVVVAQFRRERPLLRYIEDLPASDDAHPPLSFDGVENDFVPQGDAAQRRSAILQAYRAYRDRCAVELFPLRLEAEALKDIAKRDKRDVDVMVRLGKVASEWSPNFDTAARSPAASVA